MLGYESVGPFKGGLGGALQEEVTSIDFEETREAGAGLV